MCRVLGESIKISVQNSNCGNPTKEEKKQHLSEKKAVCNSYSPHA